MKLEQTLTDVNNCSPFCILLTGDFNCRNSNWWAGDTTNSNGVELSDLATRNGLHQIIDEPTHLLPTSQSCIDLFFSSPKGFIVDSGVLPSLSPTCHHQLIFAKVDFKVFYPPPYERRIWDFAKADTVSIKRAVKSIDWRRVFQPLNPSDQVEFFNTSILNICRNFIPNKTILVRDKDPAWITPEIKSLLCGKSKLYRRYIKHK